MVRCCLPSNELTHATLTVLATELAHLDMTNAEINVLANLADGESRTVSALGVAVGSKPTTLTSVLDRLERRGHVTRGSRPGDRRVVVVELTPSGRDAAKTIRETIADIENRAFRDLPVDVVAGARTVLNALAAVAR